MFDRGQEFELPEMPGVCLSCGALVPLRPAKFVFRYTSKLSLLATALALCVGFIYTRSLVYRLELPVCGVCSSHLKRAKMVAVLAFVLFLPMLVVLLTLTSSTAIVLGMTLGYLVAFPVSYGVLRSRGTPKIASVSKNHLVLDVPDYGEFVIYEGEPGTRKSAQKRPDPAEPMLNRSICEGCGFINFPNIPECKKCQTPLGQAAMA